MAGKKVFDTLLERLEKWCKEHKNKYFQNSDRTERSKQVCYEILTEFAEAYHQSKVNNCVLDDVVMSHLKALTKKIEDSHCYGFEDVLQEYLDSL